MRIMVEQFGEGLHPSEVVVAVATADGAERLIVDRRSLEGGSIAIGCPVGQDGDRLLVESPRGPSVGTGTVGCINTTGGVRLNDEEKAQIGRSKMERRAQHAGSIPEVVFRLPGTPAKL